MRPCEEVQESGFVFSQANTTRPNNPLLAGYHPNSGETN